MSENDIDNYIDKFTDERKKILVEKFSKYQDSWKKTKTGELRRKMNNHVEDLNNIITSNTDYKTSDHEERVRRKLAHIANYCNFLSILYGEDKKFK